MQLIEIVLSNNGSICMAAKQKLDHYRCIKVYWKVKAKGRKTESRDSVCRNFKCARPLAYGIFL